MNLELVEKVVALLADYPVSEIAVEAGSCRVHVVKPLGSVSGPPAPAQSEPQAVTTPAELEAMTGELLPETRVLASPMVGIFYHTEPPLAFASEVKLGQVVGCIESMKLMNDVTAEEGGRIVDILVEDGAPVDYGRPLFRLAAL